MAKHKNRFDVQVVFPDITFGMKNRADVELTPEDVATELEEFCARIRRSGKRRLETNAVDPIEGIVEG